MIEILGNTVLIYLGVCYLLALVGVIGYLLFFSYYVKKAGVDFWQCLPYILRCAFFFFILAPYSVPEWLGQVITTYSNKRS